MAAEDHELTHEQAERVWARVEAHIAAPAAPDDPPVPVEPGEPGERSTSVWWARAAIVLVAVGLALAAALGLQARSGHDEVARTLTVGDLARRAGDRPSGVVPPTRYLAVKVHHPDAVELEENWIDASGRGCFRAQQLRPVADPGGGPQCGDDMVRIGGLTPAQLGDVAASAHPADALEGALIRNDHLNTAGVRAELVATLLAWDDIDPAVRAAGYELLDRAGFRVVSSTPERTVLAGPGAEGPIEIVTETATTQVLRYSSVDGPVRRAFTPGHQDLPD